VTWHLHPTTIGQLTLIPDLLRDTTAAAATAPQLADGAQITHTSLVPDVEQFVQAGSDFEYGNKRLKLQQGL